MCSIARHNLSRCWSSCLPADPGATAAPGLIARPPPICCAPQPPSCLTAGGESWGWGPAASAESHHESRRQRPQERYVWHACDRMGRPASSVCPCWGRRGPRGGHQECPSLKCTKMETEEGRGWPASMGHGLRTVTLGPEASQSPSLPQVAGDEGQCPGLHWEK